MILAIPELSLVLLIGASGSGKSTFAQKHFRPTEILSSDFFRAAVADDENDLSATPDAFEALQFVAGKRLAGGRLTVVDATNVQPEARAPLIRLARDHHVLPVAIVFDLPERICLERNERRADRMLPRHAIHRQIGQMRRSLRNLGREGVRQVHVLSAPEAVESAVIQRQRLWTDRRDEHGPFDIIGDVHGCFEELTALLRSLGYDVTATGDGGEAAPYRVTHSAARKVVFLGDLADRGPKSPEVLRLVMEMVEAGGALCVPGNHDMKLLRALRGKNVQRTHGLGETLAQLERASPVFRDRLERFLDGLVSHCVLDGGRLVVAHAGMKAEMQGRASARVRDFALFGETTGETDEFGLPVRYNWAEEYRGRAMVVYGHTPVHDASWLNRTINIDTGCAFGGRLTALRYPEGELVSVPAARTYYQPVRPFLPEGVQAPEQEARPREDLLDITDVLGKRIVMTRLHGNVTIREEHARAALEVMSRFAVDPRWLIYLPPTMSPTETTAEPGLLEHPADAFTYYLQSGVPRVICQEKHMGSRAVLIVCRDKDAARRRFGTAEDRMGVCFTRTGRPFFTDRVLEEQLLQRVREAADTSGMWETLRTDWLCLDCELMPWSFKAQELLRQQYAAVGAAAGASLAAAVESLQQAASRGNGIGREENDATGTLLEDFTRRAEMVSRFVYVYRGYCWPVESLRDVRLAPFHLLASEGAAHVNRDHVWHMEQVARLQAADEEHHPGQAVVMATAHRLVDVTDAASRQEAVAWWEQLTGEGGEGIVVKPLDFVVRGPRGLVQPALKSRGREYLRIIYGPEYTAPEQLERLRARGLGAKRSLALREFALGVEALERFVRREPLYRVHECVFGVLALESQPVDPRL